MRYCFASYLSSRYLVLKTMEKIIAMPSLCDSTTFGLENSANNAKLATKLLGKKPEVVREISGTSTLYHYGDDVEGAYFEFNTKYNLIGYYMKYRRYQKSLVGTTITQTAVWKSLLDIDNKNLHYEVIFDILLAKYPAIMSDKIQTERGRDLWIRLMATARNAGYQIALADFNARKVHKLASDAEFRLWVHGESDAWAWHSNRHEGLRFIIYKG